MKNLCCEGWILGGMDDCESFRVALAGMDWVKVVANARERGRRVAIARKEVEDWMRSMLIVRRSSRE